MRFSDRVTLIKESNARYNTTLGEYEDTNQEGEIVPCFCMDLSIEKSKLVFGDYKKGNKVIYLRNPRDNISKVIYKGKIYKVFTVKQKASVLFVGGDNSV